MQPERSSGWSLFGGGKTSIEEKKQPLHSPSVENANSNLPPSPPDSSIGMQETTDREQVEINLIKILINSYFGIVKKNVIDSVPKAIMLLLVNQMKDSLQAELVYALYNEAQFSELLQENPDVEQKRRMCIELLKVLKKSLEIVNEVRDFKI